MIQILIGVVVVGLLAGGLYFARDHTSESPGPTQVSAVVSSGTVAAPVEPMAMSEEMKKDEMAKDASMDTEAESSGPEKVMKDEEVAVMTDESMPAQYLPHTPTAVATYAERGDVVLFFRASWCPSCRALDSDIVANLTSAPSGLTILDVDYDMATDLRRQYGVTTQHTLVQVAADGALIKKWSGGATLASVVAEVQ
jgi:thiol-disulfide isomerase/thioredoxin